MYIGVFTPFGYFYCYISTMRSDLVVSGLTILSAILTIFVRVKPMNKKKKNLSSVLAFVVDQRNPYFLFIFNYHNHNQ